MTLSTAFAAETINVNLVNHKITSDRTTVDNGDILNICSRDNDFHQPYGLSSQNSFGSSKAKEKDMLPNSQCKIVKVKNNTSQVIETTIYDRFNPQAYLVLKIVPKPQPNKKLAANNPEANKFYSPMLDEFPLSFCYMKNDGCGEKAAMAWCNSQGYKTAKDWEIAQSMGDKSITTKFIGNDTLCKRGQCDSFKSINCQSGPPTFFK